ncbi:NAD-dependent epimerase/dehydratase family protein [candidate division KSB1 bacterium]|nr:NAD-dependent epimerase/dehydratase family protein [candidate division KSB1 bacterium]
MKTIDRSKPVMLTGATGYVAGWLVKKLLEAGLTVHAAVRDPDNTDKIAHLEELATHSSGNINYFKSDLLQEGSYARAMSGCELVFHTASPFISHVKNPKKELVEPAKLGTQNVLEQANETKSVKRVVLTSSCAAIYGDNSELEETPDGVFSEQNWNTTSSLEHQPYSYSKTIAERKAWEICQNQERWDLGVINPCMVMGPALNPRTTSSESINILKGLGDGTLKFGAPDIGFGVVDVRDVAEAHYQAAFTPEAQGRYITCGHNSSLLEMAQILHARYGEHYPIPKKALPKWLLMLIGPMVNKTMTRKYIHKNVNLPFKTNNSKSREELGVTYRPLEETMEEAFQVLIDNNII